MTHRHAVVACESRKSPSGDRQNFPAARRSIFLSPATTPGPERGAHLTTRGNARLGGLSRVSRGHSPRSRPEGLRRGDHAPRQEQRRAGQRRSSEVRVSALLQTVVNAFFPAQPGFSSDESRPRSLPRRANGAPGPYPAAGIASSPRVSPPSSRHRSLTRAVFPASLAGPAPYSVWCRPPVHRLTMRTLEAPAEGSGAARTAAGAHTAATRARRSSTPTTSASTLRSSLPPDASRAKMRVALNFNPLVHAPRSITPEIASRPNPTRLFPAQTGTWATAGSSARAAAPWSA